MSCEHEEHRQGDTTLSPRYLFRARVFAKPRHVTTFLSFVFSEAAFAAVSVKNCSNLRPNLDGSIGPRMPTAASLRKAAWRSAIWDLRSRGGSGRISAPGRVEPGHARARQTLHEGNEILNR